MKGIFRDNCLRGLWPRGCLDINWHDLFYAAQAPLLSGSRSQQVWPTKAPQLSMFSVRTAWDALLSVKNWPKGSEIIISEANIPDMVQIIKLHDLVPIVARLDIDTLTVNASDILALITPKTKAILISSLFGSRVNLSEIGQVAKENNLLLVEDNAQGYRGIDYIGSPDADVSLFSFGLIKTRTTLSGSVIFAHDSKLLEEIASHACQYPIVSTAKFYQKLMRACLLKLFSQRFLFATFWRILQMNSINPDMWLSQATRGMSGADLLTAVRHQPHHATLKLLRHRLSKDNHFDADRKAIIERAQKAMRLLKGAIGKHAADSVFWALPVRVSNRERLIIKAYEAGFDVSFRASSLVSHSTEPTPFSHALENVIFLPISTDMPCNEWNRLLDIVREFDIN